MVYYRAHNSVPFRSVNALHAIPSHVFKVHFNIIIFAKVCLLEDSKIIF